MALEDEERTFGTWLARQLRRQGMTQSEVADRLGVTRAAVSAWVTGRAEPRAETIRALADVLGVETGTLLDREEPAVAAADLTWYHRPAYADGGRELGNPAAFAFDSDLATLAREATQNSIDERFDVSNPVRMLFVLHEITGERMHRFLDAVHWNDLEPHFEAAAESRQKAGRRISDGIRRMREGSRLLLLRIDDYNASGLTGPDYEDGRFAAVVRRQLDSHKRSASAGGSFGLGKAAIWAASRLGLVLINSTLSQEYEGRRERRVIGRLDLPWHRVGEEDFAGPAWFGARDMDHGGVVRSWWADEETVNDLFLTRESGAPGTSFLIVGAQQHGDEAADLAGLHAELVEGLARSFWASMIAKQGERPVLEAGVVALRDGHVEIAEERVDPTRYEPDRCRALRAFLEGTTTSSFGTKGDVVQGSVPLVVPPLRDALTPSEKASVEHQAVLLVTPAGDANARLNRIVGMRGNRMVVVDTPLREAAQGMMQFQAVVLAGIAAGDTPDAAAAERFLRAAEPPEHDDWKRTDDLTATYARGAVKSIQNFRKAVRDEVRTLARRPEEEAVSVPDVLRRGLRLKASPPSRALGYPAVKHIDGGLDPDGEWRVRVEVRLPSNPDGWVVQPVLKSVTRSGPRANIGWAALFPESNCEKLGDGRLRFRKGARTAVFSGVGDSATQPVQGRLGAVEVELVRTREHSE